MKSILKFIRRGEVSNPGRERKRRQSNRLLTLVALLFVTGLVYGTGSMYWIVKKDNELEKSRRIEIELQNNIKERDYVIQQYRQRIKQLERRVEILDAIQDLSSAGVTYEEKKKIAKIVDEISQKYGHDPFLLLALIYTESSFQPQAISPAGAHGLMQLMPSTGQALARRVEQTPKMLSLLQDAEDASVPHFQDIRGNIELGTLYLTQLMLRYKNLDHAIYAYNLGPVLFEKRRKEGGPFPQKYLAKVIESYNQLTAQRKSRGEAPAIASTSTVLNRLLAQAQPAD
ncbi:MAG: transglycosylase SLT domain-containing protein [bacterium]